MNDLSFDEVYALYERVHDGDLSQAARNNARVKLMYGVNRGKLRERQWQRIQRAQGFRCAACNCQDCKLTIDHIVPLSKGGFNRSGNIQALCEPCNKAKGDRVIDYRRRNR